MPIIYNLLYNVEFKQTISNNFLQILFSKSTYFIKLDYILIATSLHNSKQLDEDLPHSMQRLSASGSGV